jgi:hypothetical protein
MQVVKRAYQQYFRNSLKYEFETCVLVMEDFELIKRHYLHFNATASTHTITTTITTATQAKATTVNLLLLLLLLVVLLLLL